MLLTACTDTASLVQPTFNCEVSNAFVVYLDEETADVQKAINTLAAKHRFRVLETDDITPGFVARMTPQAAMGLAREHAVARIEPSECHNGPIE